MRMLVVLLSFFFFKQKAAYEIRPRDWSSDVCSSDLFVGSIIKKLRQELRDEVPLIGFAGAPWTLASYLVEGGGSKNFGEIKGLAYREPQILHALLDKLAQTTIAYALFQIEAGVQVFQLFDTWAGELSPADY